MSRHTANVEQPADLAAPDAGRAWSTSVAALLLVACFGLVGLAGLGLCSTGQRWMASEGTAFFWGLDAIVSIVIGAGIWLTGATLVASTVASVFVALLLLARNPQGRTRALTLFAAAGTAAGWGAGFGLWPDAPLVLASALAGVVLLFLPATDRDFRGRWEPVFLRPRRW